MPDTEIRVLSHLIFMVTRTDRTTTLLTDVETKTQRHKD